MLFNMKFDLKVIFTFSDDITSIKKDIEDLISNTKKNIKTTTR